MEENLNKNLESKGYGCPCVCESHQILRLRIKGEIIPNLKGEKRIGVIKRLSVWDRKTESEPIEKVETEMTVFKKYWYESLGQWGELIVILDKSEKTINSVDEIENNLDDIFKFINGKEDEYYKKVITLGIKSLFESREISYWDKTVYFIYGVNSTGESAGVALLFAFYSAFFEVGIPSKLSATGCIDKEGNIKSISGLKEKFLCVLWNEKSDSLILPQENYEEVQKISKVYYKRFPGVSKKVSFHPVSHCKDLIKLLLE